jgi:hypothetical protein
MEGLYMTESFVFYESYLKGIESLSKKSQLNLFLAVTRYALRDEDPTGLTQAERGVFELIKPTIDANAKRRANAVKGGRPKNKKPTDIFFGDKIKPNENETENKNDNGNVNDKETEKDFSKVVLSDEEIAALVEMSDKLSVENYINSLRDWQISNHIITPKPYVVIKRFIEEDAPKKNTNFTAASKSQSFTVERLERLVKTYNDRNADSLGDNVAIIKVDTKG